MNICLLVLLGRTGFVNPVRCRNDVVQFNIFHTTLQWLNLATPILDHELMKVTPCIALMGELWGVLWDFRDDWPRYNGTTLWYDHFITSTLDVHINAIFRVFPAISNFITKSYRFHLWKRPKISHKISRCPTRFNHWCLCHGIIGVLCSASHRSRQMGLRGQRKGQIWWYQKSETKHIMLSVTIDTREPST